MGRCFLGLSAFVHKAAWAPSPTGSLRSALAALRAARYAGTLRARQPLGGVQVAAGAGVGTLVTIS